MKITDIKQQVKNQTRYSIYVDSKYSFSFGESELLKAHLRIGLEFSQAELQELKHKAVVDKAYNNALNLISRRKRSRWEIEQYLKGKELEPDISAAVIEKLQASKWLDDTEFARAWVSNRRLLKSTSRRRLSQELRTKRVSDEVISQVLSEDETDDSKVLADLVASKRKQTRYQDPQKLMTYLMRQGYDYGDVKQALEDQS
jgi:regulatory protein